MCFVDVDNNNKKLEFSADITTTVCPFVRVGGDFNTKKNQQKSKFIDFMIDI